MERFPGHRRALSTTLALLLAVESIAVVSAAASSTLSARDAATHALPAATPAGQVLAEAGTTGTSWEPAASPAPAAVTTETARAAGPIIPDLVQASSDAAAAEAAAASPAPTAEIVREPAVRPAAPATPTPKPTVKPTVKPTTTTTTKTVTYSGKNHVWIPSLGINKSVAFFPCSRSTPPGNYVYRWGCAGANNVYLFGHASSVFYPLYKAYTSGRLKVGMVVYYAEG